MQRFCWLTAILRQLIAVSRDLVLAVALSEQVFEPARRITPQVGNHVAVRVWASGEVKVSCPPEFPITIGAVALPVRE